MFHSRWKRKKNGNETDNYDNELVIITLINLVPAQPSCAGIRPTTRVCPCSCTSVHVQEIMMRQSQKCC